MTLSDFGLIVLAVMVGHFLYDFTNEFLDKLLGPEAFK